MAITIFFQRIRSVFHRAGLSYLPYWCYRAYRFLTDPSFRKQERIDQRSFIEFSKSHGSSLGQNLYLTPPSKRALILSVGFAQGVQAELALIKSLELAGIRSYVFVPRNPSLLRYYGLVKSCRVLYWDDFLESSDFREAARILDGVQDIQELLRYETSAVRTGRSAASSALRILRVGRLDLDQKHIYECVLSRFATAIAFARNCEKILDSVNPELAVFVDRGYTPQAELFDTCIREGVNAITWNAAHKNNTIMLKRYVQVNRDEHPSSLSDASWNLLKSFPLREKQAQELHDELYVSYLSGEWYGEVGTQVNKRMQKPEEIRRSFGLEPEKKTAFIFPHILWDATFFWGKDLFQDYEEWLVETVRAAISNPNVNWVIKIHPANLVKNRRDRVKLQPAEVITLEQNFGKLPSHIHLIPAESDVNTYSLFEVMDYCLTVRGTIGIEAASRGVPVLTAGTGRYDHKGFTVDFDTKEEYLEKIRRIQDVPPLTNHQTELARRYAYGVFLARPLQLQNFTLEYQKDPKATAKIEIKPRTQKDWENTKDLRLFSDWAVHSNEIDFLTPSIVSSLTYQGTG